MKHRRTWSSAVAVAVALAASVSVAPPATAEQAPDAPLSAAAEIRPGAAGSGADAVAPEPQALSADAAGVTAKPEDVWDFFREVNGSRIGGGLEPSIQNGQLGAIASAWAQQQSASGTLQTDVDLPGGRCWSASTSARVS